MNGLTPRTAGIAKAALGVLFLIGAASVSFGDDAHEHNHPTKGPRGGALVELGDGELHAELLHDDEAGTVSVYLLDAEAKRYVSVETPEMFIGVRHDGQPEQFRLKATPQKGDREGLTSSYAIKSPKLVALLDDHDAEARMGIKIGGRSFVGRIAHVHDHDHGDSHAH